MLTEAGERKFPYRFAWVGESPGRHETRLGRPFVGATGQLMLKLWGEACEEIGIAPIPRPHIFITNAALCEPNDNGDAREHRLAVQCCRPRLLAELSKLPPDVGLLVMGKWAHYALTGQDKKIAAYHGFTLQFNRAHMRALTEEEKPDAQPEQPPDDLPF